MLRGSSGKADVLGRGCAVDEAQDVAVAGDALSNTTTVSHRRPPQIGLTVSLRLQDVVRPSQLEVVLAQPFQFGLLFIPETGSSAGVDVRLLDPEAQRLGSKRSADPVCSTARKPNCTRLPIKPAYCGRGLP